MSFSDPIAEMLTKVRNAKGAQLRYVDFNTSNIKLKILEILKLHGFIENYLVNEELHKVRVFLKYNRERKSVLNGLKRISSPGLRKYIPSDRIPRPLNGMGLAILSTSKGVVDGETARSLNVGGELLCTIW